MAKAKAKREGGNQPTFLRRAAGGSTKARRPPSGWGPSGELGTYSIDRGSPRQIIRQPPTRKTENEIKRKQENARKTKNEK